jgi:hypothetical protein
MIPFYILVFVTFLFSAITPKTKDATPNADTIEAICFTVTAIMPALI